MSFPNDSPQARKRSGRGLATWIDHHLARLSYAVLVEPTWLEINRHEISVPLAPVARGLRIVQLTDFHFRQRVPVAYIERCVEAANNERPDLIALTGDYVHKGPRFAEEIADLLGGLQAPLGVYAVLGNHDYGVRHTLRFRRRVSALHERITGSLAQRGIRVLHNELMTVEVDGHRYQISGVEDLWSGRCRPEQALASLDPALPHIMLAHHPRTIELLSDQRCDLMLSGHTHGGQVHLKRFGSVTLSRRMKRYAAGLYSHGAAQLYVNKGVGYGVKIRYNRRPEIAVFDLVPAAPVTGNGDGSGENPRELVLPE